MTETAVRDLQDQVASAANQDRALHIQGGGTKTDRLPAVEGNKLDTGGLQGIIEYAPSELVVTARAGMPLKALQARLNENGQMLGFEPPAYGEAATVGGTVACGLSGPRRAYAGALRDFVLGVRCLNGRGEDLRFGGQVMKNVAGYDIARLMAGAQGTLGVLLEVSFKVLPLPASERTYCQTMSVEEALTHMNALAARPLPLSAAAWFDGTLFIRCSGSQAAVEAAGRELRMATADGGADFWRRLCEQQLAFFDSRSPVWRLSLASTASQPAVDGNWLIDWGGAQRWLCTDAPAATVQSAAAEAGGYATLLRNDGQGDFDQGALPELPAPLRRLHQRVKQAFDPVGIFNPGLLYTEAAC